MDYGCSVVRTKWRKLFRLSLRRRFHFYGTLKVEIVFQLLHCARQTFMWWKRLTKYTLFSHRHWPWYFDILCLYQLWTTVSTTRSDVKTCLLVVDNLFVEYIKAHMIITFSFKKTICGNDDWKSPSWWRIHIARSLTFS